MSKWMKGAVKNGGGLHEALGVPRGEKISSSRIESEIARLKRIEKTRKLTSKERRLMRMLVLARTFREHGGGGRR